MANVLSCNLVSYRGHVEAAYKHLPEIGVKNIEIPIPAMSEVVQVMNRLALVELAPTTLMASAEIGSDEYAGQFAQHCDVAAKMGVEVIFTSVNAGEVPKDDAYRRLHEAGVEAAKRGVTIAMETHPDLMTNGDVAVETLTAVDHPNVRMNFDTANIHYYNEDTTTEAELQKVAHLVAGVHLKDTSGEYKTWNFPTLGTGVVDYPEVFRILNGEGFDGPFTMELEGVEGQKFNAEEACDDVAKSVAYLRTFATFT
ncbi:MAG TPA: sugar phosphate isomerase/epimerase family protein [Armatimonadota bacterium]|nr:sugar phosphate isomerase/epimerase family protein [Armatimonadota bacterium]